MGLPPLCSWARGSLRGRERRASGWSSCSAGNIAGLRSRVASYTETWGRDLSPQVARVNVCSGFWNSESGQHQEQYPCDACCELRWMSVRQLLLDCGFIDQRAGAAGHTGSTERGLWLVPGVTSNGTPCGEACKELTEGFCQPVRVDLSTPWSRGTPACAEAKRQVALAVMGFSGCLTRG